MAYFSRSASARRRVEAQVNHDTLCPICDSGDSHYVVSRKDARLLRCRGCHLIRLEPRKGATARAVEQKKAATVERLPGRQSQKADEGSVAVDWPSLLETIQRRVRALGVAPDVLRVGLFGSASQAAHSAAAHVGIRFYPINLPGGLPPSDQSAFERPPIEESKEQQLDAFIIDQPLERYEDPLSTLIAAQRALSPTGVLAIIFEALLPNSDRLLEPDLTATVAARFLYGRDTAESLLFRAGFGRMELSLPSSKSKGHAAATAQKRYADDPANRQSKLSIIMPVFNEKSTFLEIFELLYAKQLPNLDKEIIIVESNSTDGTKDVVRSIANRPGVEVVWQERPRGKGNAVREGLSRAKGDFVLIQDADLEYDIDDYDILLDPLCRNHAAFVLGVRHGRHGNSWKMRHFEDQAIVSQVMNIGHVFFTTLFNVVYGQRLSDPFTMFKVFRRDCIAGVMFECDRFDFDWELVAKIVRRGYTPVEIPVNYTSRSFAEGKKVTFFRDPVTWLRACIKYRFVKV